MNVYKDNKDGAPADPSSSIQAGRSDIPDESKAPIEATTVPEASDTKVFDSDEFFDSFEEEIWGSSEEANDGFDDETNDETKIKINVIDGNKINFTLRSNNEINVAQDTKGNESFIIGDEIQSAKSNGSIDTINNTIGDPRPILESVTENTQTNINGNLNSSRSKDGVELMDEGQSSYEPSTVLPNHTSNHLLVSQSISHTARNRASGTEFKFDEHYVYVPIHIYHFLLSKFNDANFV